MTSVLSIVPCLAYLGPGGALSGIGSFLALISAILLAVIGFLWYPIKRLLRRLRGRRKDPGHDAPGAPPARTPHE